MGDPMVPHEVLIQPYVRPHDVPWDTYPTQ